MLASFVSKVRAPSKENVGDSETRSQHIPTTLDARALSRTLSLATLQFAPA
jgi:hypothetical protein